MVLICCIKDLFLLLLFLRGYFEIGRVVYSIWGIILIIIIVIVTYIIIICGIIS